MKHLISVSALMVSVVACSSDPANGGGTSGASGATAGAPGTAGKPSTSGGASGVSGSSATGGAGSGAGGATAGAPSGSTAGAAPIAGAPGTAGGPGSGGVPGTGGAPGAAGGAAAGAPGSGGSGPTASFKCDNLSLAPSGTTSAPKPAGAVGGMKVVDWAGFKGAASFTFDDNTPSQLANYDKLKATGGHLTWFLIAGSAGSGYKATIADGQEIANHTYTHGNPDQNDVIKGQSTLKTNFGVEPHSLAAPNCAEGWSSMAAPAKLFQNRGPCGNVAAVSPRDNTSPFLLPAYLPPTNADAANLSGQIAAGKWRIYVIHGFDSQNGTYQPVPIASVTGAMSKAVSDGYWVEGMTNVGAYWAGQKLIPASASTNATWTLPANFPPNMCVRITTSGGTVTQKGETIAWDPHGYYQISLDAGEVTIK